MSHEEISYLKDLGSSDPETVADAIIDLGKQCGSAHAPTVVPFLTHPSAEVRAAAIRSLAFYWGLLAYREQAAKMMNEDPDVEVRVVAMMGWSELAPKQDRATLLRLREILGDRSLPPYLRANAFDSLLSLAEVPFDVHRLHNVPVDATLDAHIDWAWVDRLCGLSGS